MTGVEGGRGRLVTSDPTTLRALAHPLRVEILGILDEVREATATQIAERVGHSPSNCSFHLRQLERAGYVERAEARGTSRPWRPAHDGRELSPDPTDPESVRSSAAVGAMYVQHEARRLTEFLTAVPTVDPEWISTVVVHTSEFWATADELRELGQRLSALTEHLHGREADPSLRPPGSRRAHLLGALNPDPRTPPTPAP